MKIAFVANSLELNRRWGGTLVSIYLAKAFKNLGYDITLLSWEQLGGDYSRLRSYDIVGTLDYNINGTILKKLAGVETCFFWAIDDPEIFDGVPFGYDHYFTHSKGSMALYDEKGWEVSYLPFGYDTDFYHDVDGAEKEHDCVYVGNGIASKSYDIILDPASKFNLALFGKDWNKPSNIRFRRFLQKDVNPEEVNKINSQSNIVLGMHRESQRITDSSFIMRDFEVLAGKNFYLTDSFEGCDEFFKGGIVTSSSPKETVELIEYYLDNEDERKTIAQKGYDLITKGKNTYEDRAKEIIRVLSI